MYTSSKEEMVTGLVKSEIEISVTRAWNVQESFPSAKEVVVFVLTICEQ